LPTPTKFYLEDLSVGQIFTSDTAQLDEKAIVEFARRYDPQPFHLDASAAKDTLFEGLAASGWHTASTTMRLLVEGGMPVAGGLIGAGVEISWPKPTRPGDTLHVTSEVTQIAPSRSRPDRGIVTVRSETSNQNGSIVQVMTSKLVVFSRSTGQGDMIRG